MNTRVSVKQSSAALVSVRPSKAERVSPREVAEGLRAEEMARTEHGGSPISMHVLRQALFSELRSTGGRPGFADVERRKVPISNAVWRAAESMAERLAGEGFRPSPAQVVSVVLTMTFRNFEADGRAMRRAEEELRQAARAV